MVAGSVLGLLLLLIMGFAIFQPVKVVPRLGLAPGYTLTDNSVKSPPVNGYNWCRWR